MVKLPIPEIIGGERRAIMTDLTDGQAEYLTELRARAEGIRRDPRRSLPDNMLAVYTDAQKMALDLRMVDAGAP
jgi:N12 class adenine-specific DNA methylase